MLRFCVFGLITIKNIDNQQVKLGLVLEEKMTVSSVLKLDNNNRVEFGLVSSDALLRRSLRVVLKMMKTS